MLEKMLHALNSEVFMKAFYSLLIFLTLAVAFFSCSSDGLINDKEIASEEGNVFFELDQQPPPYVWVDPYDKLDPICRDEQRKLVYIHDNHKPEIEIDWDYVYSHLPGYVPGSGMVAEETMEGRDSSFYSVNGIEMTQEEYIAYEKEFSRKYYEELAKERENKKRDLPIPCVLYNLYYNLLAALTEEEIADLQEKYSDIEIFDYVEPIAMGDLKSLK
jgi:hypothetical protein